MKREDIEDNQIYIPGSLDDKVDFSKFFNISVSNDKFTAEINIYPSDRVDYFIKAQDIYAQIKEKSIVYGVDDEKIEYIVKNKLFGKYVIARGKMPVDGVDAVVKDFFSKSKLNNPLVMADGTTNYKNIDLFDTVMEGDIISSLTPGKDGEDGITVMGGTISCKKPKRVSLLKGKGNHISEDGLYLIANTSGKLNFSKGCWNISEILNINGDIDNSTGNITFYGDIIIKGDVQEGYTVKSENGDVFVYGSVCSGNVYGRNIEISRGVNGGGIGKLEASGDIKTKFIENATVSCKGDIFVQSILNSQVNCDGSVKAKSGKGVIIGGCVNSYNNIECQKLGSSGNVMTTINIGFRVKIFSEYKELLEQLKQLKIELAKVEKNTKYIQEKLKDLDISEERRQILNREKKKRPINIFSQRNIIMKLKRLKMEFSNISEDCYFKCNEARSPFKICFYDKFYIKSKEDMFNVYARVKDNKLIVEKN